MADGVRAPAILSALRFELEQREVGFRETHGPDERGLIDVEFEGWVRKAEAERQVRYALDTVAEDDWHRHFDA